MLVTGGSGFIGAHVTSGLCQAGGHVLSVDARAPRRRPPAACQAVQCDIRSGDLAGIVTGFAPHVVVHLAAQVSVTDSIAFPGTDADVNVRGTVAVAEACAAAGAGLLVFAGSCAIYGDPAMLPVGEEHPLAPVTPYGLSKASALGYAEWFAEFRGLPVTSLILGNVYGPGQHGGVISQFLADAAAGRPCALHGHGHATRDFVHVADVTDAVLRACASPAAGRVNIGSGTETSIARVHELVAAAAGHAVPPVPAPSRPGDIGRMSLRASRA
ncbi:MAG: NAD-dependent epimerase/dehydratase family protein, partial [Streptosporangiaceae bacterium]